MVGPPNSRSARSASRRPTRRTSAITSRRGSASASRCRASRAEVDDVFAYASDWVNAKLGKIVEEL